MQVHRGAVIAALCCLLACEADPAAPVSSSALATSSSSAATAASSRIAPVPLPGPLTPAPPLSERRAAALSADVAARITAARGAPDLPTHLQPVGDNFVVVAGDAAAPVDAAADVIRRTTDALYNGPLQHRPDRGALVYVYSSQHAYEVGLSLHVFNPPASAAKDIATYDPRSRCILVHTDGAGIFSVAHEIAHVLVGADMPHAPAWLAEGLPSLFELPDFSHPGEIHGKAHFRLQTLRDALASKAPGVAASIRLDALFAMTTWGSFRGDPATEYLHFALAREALRWLDDDRHELWQFWALMRDTIVEDPEGTAAFTRVVGKSPADATADFLAWVQSPKAEGKP
jgi:hypothetical protein